MALHPFGVVHAGQRGNDDPGGVAVVEGQVGAVDLEGEQRVGVEHLIGLSTAWLNAPDVPATSPSPSATSVTPAASARSRSRTPVHVCVVDHPSTHAIGRVAVCCGMARSSAPVSCTGGAPPVSESRQAVAGLLRVDLRGCGGAVDLKVVGAVAVGAAAGEQQRGTAREPADGLPDGQDGDQQRRRHRPGPGRRGG